MNATPWIAFVILITCLAYFVRGWLLRNSFTSIEDFFNFSRNIPRRLFSDTFIATNVTFTSIYLVVAATSYDRGNLTLWIIIAWITGLILFRNIFPRIQSFFEQGHTLHEFLGQRYGSNEIRRLASISTIIVFIGTLGIEFWGVVLLLESLGLGALLTTSTIAIAVALMTAAYTALGGFKAAVLTDRWQLYMIFGLTIAMYAVIFGFGGLLQEVDNTKRVQLIVSTIDPSSLFSDIVFAISMFVLFVPFNFCVMDMWQRCTATRSADRITAIRSVGSFKTCISFGLIFLVPILVGLSARGMFQEGSLSDSIIVFPEYLKRIAGPPAIRIPVLCVIYAGFFAALMSTADTLLINASYSFMYDVIGPLRKINYADLDRDSRVHTIAVFRFWVFVFGLLAAPLMFVGLTLYQLVLAVFSSQIVLFTPIIFAIFRPERAASRSQGAWLSIVSGFAAALACAAIGRLTGIATIVDATPVLAFCVSLAVFFIVPPLNNSEEVQIGGQP
jgi:Na+/proline symporter